MLRIELSIRRLTGIIALCVLIGTAHAEDKGESKKEMALKSRAKAPAAADVDAAITIDAMLNAKGPTDLNEEKAATIEGVVVMMEREEDNDYHLVVAPAGGETSTTKWVIVEATPGWRKTNKHLVPSELKKLHGHTIRATGWLYYEPDQDNPDPRGTNWELHPVTDIVIVS